MYNTAMYTSLSAYDNALSFCAAVGVNVVDHGKQLLNVNGERVWVYYITSKGNAANSL